MSPEDAPSRLKRLKRRPYCLFRQFGYIHARPIELFHYSEFKKDVPGSEFTVWDIKYFTLRFDYRRNAFVRDGSPIKIDTVAYVHLYTRMFLTRKEHDEYYVIKKLKSNFRLWDGDQ